VCVVYPEPNKRGTRCRLPRGLPFLPEPCARVHSSPAYKRPFFFSATMSHSKRTVDIRKPYSGLSRSLVIAIDVGTTFSGVRIPFLFRSGLVLIDAQVSYAILEPGEIPKIHGVTRYVPDEKKKKKKQAPTFFLDSQDKNM